MDNIFIPSSNNDLSSLIISYGSTDKGLVSQQFINTASALSSTFGVLLKGLVLNPFHNPESNKAVFISFVEVPRLNNSYSSFASMSISMDKNLLLAPLLIDLTVPPAGYVKYTPGFFLSSKIF